MSDPVEQLAESYWMSMQQALTVLQGQLGATVLAVAPADPNAPPVPVPMFAAPNVPIEVPVTGRLSALCCGGWLDPAGVRGFVTCADCPGVGVEFYAPLIATCATQFCGADGAACPSCGLTADDLAAWPGPLYGTVPAPAADGAPTDRQAQIASDAPAGPADGGESSAPTITTLPAIVTLAAPLPVADEQPAVREPVVAGGVVLRAPASSPPAETEPLRVELTEAVMAYCLNDPRTLQTQIGPSEIGHPCEARIARRVLDLPKFNDRADPWASFVGQAVHAKLADVFAYANAARLDAGLPEYVIEQRVYVVGDGSDDGDIGGSCDLMRDGLVVDHKIVGNDSMRELKSAGWQAKGGIYSAQLDLYGYGYERAGHTITDVALAAWPRSGFLAGLHVMRRAYDRQAALDALARLGRIAGDAANLDAANDDAVWNGIIPTAPSKQCAFCPWYDPDRAVPNARGGYSPRADRTACGFGRAAEKHRGAS